MVSLPVTLLPAEGHGRVDVPPSSGLETSTVGAPADELLEAAEFHGLRLLLVEDNELNALLAARLMAALGFEVVTAVNGAIAVQAVERQEFDVILMDCQMPVMDGYEATRAIRKMQSSTAKRTPVIAVTAYALDGDRERCLAAGMDDFLAKPYALSDLRPKLQLWTRTSPLRQ